jgi:SAM-dependent methyltransferase
MGDAMKECDMEAINVDELMEKIKAEVRKRKDQNGELDQSLGGPCQAGDLEPNASHGPIPMESREDGYHINDLLKYHDEDFVATAYQAVLGRLPDSSAFKHFLSNLRSGKKTKAEVLGRLRYSAEGRARHVRIDGLFWNFLIQSSFGIPVLGYFMRLIIGIANLPRIMRNLQTMEESAFAQLKDQKNRLNGVWPKMDSLKAEMDRYELKMGSFQSKMGSFQSKMGSFQSKMDEVTVLNEEFAITLKQKAEIATVDEQLSQKVDTAEIIELLKHKADLWVLEELRERKADHEALEEVATQKADREELAELNEKKVGREELAAVSEAKVDREELVAVSETKVDREELVKLNEKKVGREELVAVSEAKVDREELVEFNASVQGQLRDIVRQIKDHKINLLDQERRLRLLLKEARKRLPEAISKDQIEKMVKEEDHMLDAMYMDFEDKFRGTRADIKRRQKVYLPVLNNAGVGTAERPVLDVGCGRGEWLELLKDNAFVAIGVDTNHSMQRVCEDLGLRVEMADAIEFLRKQEANSLGAVTGFQIVEHLPTKNMIALFDEAMRVLKPGGIVIFETPNPENILVGSYTFYTDPSHKNPIPPDTLAYIIENRGFVEVEIIRSSPMNYAPYNEKDVLSHIFHLFNSEMDYAVVARKPL